MSSTPLSKTTSSPDHAAAYEYELVTLAIKTPTEGPETFLLKARLNGTVNEVKRQLSLLYPTKPVPENQRLIFGGKVLQDEMILNDVLKRVDTSTTQTVHMVVRNGIGTAIRTSTQAGPATQELTPSLRQRSTPSGEHQLGIEDGISLPLYNQSNEGSNRELFTRIGGIPTRYCTDIYYRCMIINGAPYLVPCPSAGSFIRPVDEIQRNFEPADVRRLFSGDDRPQGGYGQPQLPQLPQQMAANSRPRVRITIYALPHFYLICKLIFAILLFSNGTMSRLLTLYAVAIVIFLHQTGALAEIRRRLFPSVTPEIARIVNHNNNATNPSQNENQNTQTNDSDPSQNNDESGNPQPERQPIAPPSRIQLVKLFITGFVTSLIPGIHEADPPGQPNADMVA